MNTLADIFAAFGGPAAVARILDVGPSTASEMKRRRSIPPEYWLRLVREAERRGLPDITTDALATIHARNKGRLPEPEAEASAA
jgi:hypothetical protein